MFDENHHCCSVTDEKIYLWRGKSVGLYKAQCIVGHFPARDEDFIGSVFLFKDVFVFYVFGCLVLTYVSAPHACSIPRGTEKGVRSPENGATDAAGHHVGTGN